MAGSEHVVPANRKTTLRGLVIRYSRAAILTVFAMALLTGCNRASPVTFRNPYDSPGPLLEGIYHADREVDVPEGFTIRAVIVPHHLVATRSIAAGIRVLTQQHIRRILLLSPDHNHQCPTILCSVNGVFQTEFGVVKADPRTVQRLTTSPLVTLTPALFEKEHGVYAVLPYIAHYLPGVPVTPVALSQKRPWRASSKALLETIAAELDDDTVLVVSSDFSHYRPLSQADTLDDKTAETLFAKDLEGIAKLENPGQSDCPNCLWTLASIASQKAFYNPSVLFHTNSARLLENLNAKSTTSHFAIAWYANSRLGSEDLTVGGDVTFTRGTPAWPLPPDVQRFWTGTGPRLVNLEGPLAEDCESRSNPYLFCNPLSLWKANSTLATHWGVMNNHALDLGTEGFLKTRLLLRQERAAAVTQEPSNGRAYRLFALTSLINPVKEAGAIQLTAQQHEVIEALGNRTPDVMSVVFVHYGHEYHALTDASEDGYLRSFVDAGADAVIGCHSHVPGDMVMYKGKPIFRGLGNFLFDQHESVATATVKAVRLRMEDGHARFETLLAADTR
jgi:poly-gamma-glutamate synthesis protein (capsule biosynthesis protein)